jgi:hypothetical protein
VGYQRPRETVYHGLSAVSITILTVESEEIMYLIIKQCPICKHEFRRRSTSPNGPKTCGAKSCQAEMTSRTKAAKALQYERAAKQRHGGAE